MGEVAEMMLDGTLCSCCGVFIGREDLGFPQTCSDCGKESRAAQHAQLLARHQQIKKTPCPVCKKKVKACGLADHQRDAHGVKA